ncbi:MAG: Flp pilus assembly complex ATPase component TadA [Actinomycetota bacterium]|nr:Flp pilus assembly complex ATPase component TadA [Actinomycetota bacterium]
MPKTMGRRLSDLLLLQGHVSGADLGRAMDEQESTGEPLPEVLLRLGLLSPPQLYRVLADHLGLDFVDLSEYSVDPAAVGLIPDALARRHTMVPIGFSEAGALVIAMSDPSNVLALDDARNLTDLEIQPVVATPQDITAAIDRYARMGDAVEDAFEGVAEEEDEDLAAITGAAQDAPVVKFVNALIAQAVQDRASDLHFEPQEHDFRVRYRVDGVMHEVTRQRRSIQPGVVSRLKIMAGLDIAERRVPQDGRVSLRAGGKEVDLRVSSLPTVYGEKLVLRILDKNSALLNLSELSLLPENYRRYEASFRKPYGMILVTGPTGSGKSTTLYATLNEINEPTINTVTVEDPVEYQIPGINQVPINPRAGLTFPKALRAILRQDPDVVLVGEMRDLETAQIGTQAALTGHLVLSTLHTNDAPSAVTRLTEMGIDGFLVASAVACVLAQRLGRRLCRQCREPYQPDPSHLESAGMVVNGHGPPTLFRAVGCRNCAQSGYRGRIAFQEVMPVTEDIGRAIVERASTNEITHLARAQGMRTLREDALEKVRLGETTLEEVARVIV